MIDNKKFVDSINEYDCAYQKFANNHLPSYKEYFVESSDDAKFYSYYLATIHHLPQLMKCYGCDGKEEVLREYSKYTGKKAGFIVDLDYLPFDRKKYEKVIVTTGYSMENFFFYNDGFRYNFEKIFMYYFSSNYKKMLNTYMNELCNYINKYQNYYAFFKTCMEFSGGGKTFNNHLKIKDLLKKNEIDLSIEIEKEINALDPKFRERFKERDAINYNIIGEADYMLIRGHDIFDHLFDFLIEHGVQPKKYKILELAYGMKIPKDFLNQLYSM